MCCPYHDNPMNMELIKLPARILFHSPNGKKLHAVLHNEKVGRLSFGGNNRRSTTSWPSACQKAFQLCNEKMPSICNPMYCWSVNIEGEDIFLSDIKEDSYIHGRGEQIDQTDEIFCSDQIQKKANEAKYKNVHLKMNIDEAIKCDSDMSDHCISKKKQKDTKFEKDKQVNIVKNRTVSPKKESTTKHPTTKRSAEISIKSRKIKVDDSFLIEEDEEEDDFVWTPHDEVWTTEVFEEYVLRYPENAPELLHIKSTYKSVTTNSKFCNPIYECVFKHPKKQINKTLDVGSAVLYNVTKYKNIIKNYCSDNT